MTLVQIRKITKQFRKGDEVITPLQEVNLDIEQGDFVSLMGASGSRQKSEHLPSTLSAYFTGAGLVSQKSSS